MRISTAWLGLTAAALTACSSGAPIGSTGRQAAGPAPVAEPIVVMSSEPREQLPDEQVQQVLNRLSYGARPGDAEKVRATGVDKWIAMQLAPERIDDAAAEQLVAHYETLHESTGDLVETFRQVQQARRREQMQLAPMATRRASEMRAGGAAPAIRSSRELARQAQRIVGDVQSAKLARAVVSERQLEEVMVDFWENHFTVFAGKGQTRLFLAVVRPRRDPAARAGQVPRPARRGGEEPGDAVLPRQVAERRGQPASDARWRRGSRHARRLGGTASCGRCGPRRQPARRARRREASTRTTRAS